MAAWCADLRIISLMSQTQVTIANAAWRHFDQTGDVELEPDVEDWFLALNETDAARVRFHIDRLAELGPPWMNRTPVNCRASCESCASTWPVVPPGSPTGSLRDGASYC